MSVSVHASETVCLVLLSINTGVYRAEDGYNQKLYQITTIKPVSECALLFTALLESRTAYLYDAESHLRIKKIRKFSQI